MDATVHVLVQVATISGLGTLELLYYTPISYRCRWPLLQLQLWTNGTLEEHLPATTFGAPASSTYDGWYDDEMMSHAEPVI